MPPGPGCASWQTRQKENTVMHPPMWSSNPEVAFKALAPSHLQSPRDWPDWKTGEINLIERPARQWRTPRVVVQPLLDLIRRIHLPDGSRPVEVPAGRGSQAATGSVQREVIGGTP